MLRSIILIALLLPPLSRAQRSTELHRDNAELTLIFNEDQRVRQSNPLGPDEPKITRTDADRLALVKQNTGQRSGSHNR